MRRTKSFALYARIVVCYRIIVVDCIEDVAIVAATVVLQIVHVVGFGLCLFEFVVEQTDVGRTDSTATATVIAHRWIDITKLFTIG